MLQMTFPQYIDNPLGKHNAVFSQRNMYKSLYTKKLDDVLLREAGTIKYSLYYDKKKDEFWAHLKIPSEVVPKFYYDVIIQFYTDNNGLRTDATLNEYYVRFFSNDPAFVFTYLKVFKDNGMYIEQLKSKSPKLALKKDPVEKNPYKIPGYVKSIYFAYLYMKARGLFTKDKYRTGSSKPLDIKSLIKDVEDSDKKIADRQRLGEEEAKKRRDEELRTSRAKATEHASQVNAFNARSAKRSGISNVKLTPTTTRRSSTVKTVKQTRTVKNSKRG